MPDCLAAVLVLASAVAGVDAAGAGNSSDGKVAPQAGVLEGANPIKYSASNPITLFIIQAMIIIIFCRLLHYPLSYFGQPRVIAEVIGGILLGPSVMMRIPGFQENIFPTESMPVLNNVANLGLIIFLFLVALEVDVRLFTNNWRVALSVGLAGMIVPFGLGCAIAWGLYHEFRLDSDTVPIDFGVYALFIGTALAITAFPVLCRILTELKLLRSSVGVTVLAAGIGNDVTGWILLALCVALVNNANGLAALYALLCTIAWALFLCFAVRPGFMWCLRRSGSIQNGPTQGMVSLTLLIVLFSSWFTGIIGVHPIFGAFLAGLICPHEGGFAIKLTEKIEDLISVLFLPLYFALSGLSTDLGLLDDGMTWAYVIGVIAIAFSGKIIGGTLAAKLSKLEWRESFTIGVLMSCKGLVELIVLNIGLQARILSRRTFTIFVVMAVVTTVATTPLVKWLYPPWYQDRMEKWRRGETDKDGNPISSTTSADEPAEQLQQLNSAHVRRLLVYLRLDSLPSLFTFIALLGGDKLATRPVRGEEEEPSEKGEVQVTSQPAARRPLEVHGLRILELTERTSSVMQVTEGEEYFSEIDPVVNAFRTFSRLNDVAVSGKVAIVPQASYSETLTKQASDVSSDFVLVPWSEYGSITEDTSVPFVTSAQDRYNGRGHLDFINKTLEKSVCNTGIFINQNFGGLGPAERPNLKRSKSAMSVHSQRDAATLPVKDKSHQVFFPFLGGVDDRVALRLALQLAKSPHVTLTVAHFNWAAYDSGDEVEPSKATGGTKDATKVVEEASGKDLALLSSLRSLLSKELAGRVTLAEVNVTKGTAVAEAVSKARSTVGNLPKNAGDIVVVGRSHPELGDAQVEFGLLDLKKTVGSVAEQLVNGGIKASVLVVKAGGAGLQW
ncbi:K(+)/H(+) antiporter 1 [Diaporthe helianthi]|uniref:K(+)/H(+) antiporter 1 n=1 Tax=Diaporthe helianthi TaxID=158607 RepID=A0A2P5IC14_DIAHE|nr:K(+)/H(+) antiporter 1 [Diaporthe helianthi]